MNSEIGNSGGIGPTTPVSEPKKKYGEGSGGDGVYTGTAIRDKDEQEAEKKLIHDDLDDHTDISLQAVLAFIKDEAAKILEFYDSYDEQIADKDDLAEPEETENTAISSALSAYHKSAQLKPEQAPQKSIPPFPYEWQKRGDIEEEKRKTLKHYEHLWQQSFILKEKGITHIPHHSSRKLDHSLLLFCQANPELF